MNPGAEFFKSELYEADFQGNPEDVIARLNRWAEENTNGMIPEVIAELPPATVLMLMNAVSL